MTFIKTAIIFLLGFCGLQAQFTIAIQPFNNVDTNVLVDILSSISREYDSAKIVVLQKVAMPDFAYYKPRNRYRAEKLLQFLDTLPVERTKIVGFTDLDISTTKNEHYDWGIFGLGEINGASCVCSVYRLKKNAGSELYVSRIKKVIIHELGHTFGLEHCTWPLCVMADYQGTIKSLDRSGFHLCAQCRAKYKRINNP